jgi:hypothetical protein
MSKGQEEVYCEPDIFRQEKQETRMAVPQINADGIEGKLGLEALMCELLRL